MIVKSSKLIDFKIKKLVWCFCVDVGYDKHKKINYSRAFSYGNGTHANGIENFWSFTKEVFLDTISEESQRLKLWGQRQLVNC